MMPGEGSHQPQHTPSELMIMFQDFTLRALHSLSCGATKLFPLTSDVPLHC